MFFAVKLQNLNAVFLHFYSAVDSGYFVTVCCSAVSISTIRFIPCKQKETNQTFTVSRDGYCYATPFYVLRLNTDGQICYLHDFKNDREIISESSPANLLCLYEDRPVQFDAWNIDADYDEKRTVLKADRIETVCCGSQRLTVAVHYTGKHCEVSQQIVFYSENRRIDFVTQVDWHESHRLLKVLFPVNIRTTLASFDIQYGYVTRANHRNTSWDQAKFETVAHKWADLSDSSYGVSLLNDCKYGYSVLGNTLSLSLLRSAKEPDATADMGSHSFTYSLLPHSGNLTQGETIAQSNALNHPIFALPGKPDSISSPFCLSGDGIQLDAVKIAEDQKGVIIRLHEALGAQQKFTLSSPFKISEWCVCDLLEVPLEDFHLSDTLTDTLTPFALRTYCIRFKHEKHL